MWFAMLGTVGALAAGDAEAAHAASVPGPLALIENRGQWDVDAKLIGKLGPLVVRIESRAIALQMPSSPRTGALLRLRFEGGAASTVLEGRGKRPERYSYFLGSDHSEWQRNVPAFDEAMWRGAWSGVDLAARAEGGRLKYDLLVAPSAGLANVVIAVEGADGMRLRSDGSLVIDSAAGPLVQPMPESYAVGSSGARTPISVHYRLLEGMRFGFEAAGLDPALPLVIDPGLIWSSYLGSASIGGVGDRVQAIALGPNGEAIATGIADWMDFPVTPGAYSSPPGQGEHAFVSMFHPSGSSLLYSCVVGGDGAVTFGYTRALGVGIDAKGEVVVAGWTSFSDFPTTPGAYDSHKNSPSGVAFVFKLKRDGSDLVYSTFVEGSQYDEARALAVSPDGAAIIGGFTSSQDFPVTPGAFDTIHGPGDPAFLARLSPDGSRLEWATYLAGTARVNAVALDALGNVLATGVTGGTFPTTSGAFDTTFNDGQSTWDGFVAKLAADGSSLIWGTYLGGLVEDRPNAIAVDGAGGVVVAGATMSWDFPLTPTAFQTQHFPSAGTDMFVTRLDASGSVLIGSTYIGGIGHDEVFGVAIDAGGCSTIAGKGGGASFPVTLGAHDSDPIDMEGIVARLAPDLGRLFYSSFVGGTGTDQFNALAMDALGVATTGGWTTGDYPVTLGAFATTPFGGQMDGMVTRMDLLPKGAVAFGSSTPACLGPIAIGVTEMPAAGSTTFALYASGPPPGALAFLGLAQARQVPALPIAGVALWIDPAPGLVILPAHVPPTPYVEVTVPIPAGTSGLQAFAQFAFVDTAACASVGSVSASNALALTVQ